MCTHIADIDYETIITYTGTYDDMVVAKTQVRSQIEGQNAQREKKIAQLNDFIARFSAGTRSSQVQSRRKEVVQEFFMVKRQVSGNRAGGWKQRMRLDALNNLHSTGRR